MEIRENLTCEKVSRRFANQFDLVNYAIMLVEEFIVSGRQPRVKCDIDNPVQIILEEIFTCKDGLEEEKEEKKIFFEDLVSKKEMVEV